MKKGLIITLLLATVVLAGCNTKGEIAKKEEEKLYFDFSHTEIVSKLQDEFFIDFTDLFTADGTEKGERIASYDSIADLFLSKTDIYEATVNYFFTYDAITDNVSKISFIMDRNLSLSLERYLYRVGSIIACIEPTLDTEKILNEIEKGFNECDFAIYEGEILEIHASRSEELFTASFRPIKDTKGE